MLKEKLPAPPICVAESSLANDIDDLTAGVLPKMRLAVVDDPNTARAFGDRVHKALRGEHVTFDAPPEADDEAVEYIRQKTARADALVAVGGGSINDICKYAAFLDDKPYVVFPTAASMNGWLSANASIRVKGYKKTCAAKMPVGVFCDMSVIAAAPVRLAKSGLGDSLARPTAQADWLLSHLLLGTAYDETPFGLLAPHESQLFDNARGVALADKETLALLMRVLLLSGLGMTLAGGSYPASQAEHMIAHAYGMSKGPGALHGEEVGVTSLYMAQMQERLLRGVPKIRMDDFDEEKIIEIYGRHAAEEAKKAFSIKQQLRHSRGSGNPYAAAIGIMDPRPRGDDGIKDWSAIAEKISRVTVSPARLESILKAAEAPSRIEQLGWNKADFDEVSATARFLRERFTFLDLQ